MTDAITTRRAAPDDAAAISKLHARVFGPGRFARTAYRVREGTRPVSRFCRVAVLGRELVAALRFTEVTVGGEPGALLLGPLAVAPAFAGQGHGKRLVAEGIEAARVAGLRLIVLVGDEPYYGRFGFKPAEARTILLPGPADPRRLLILALDDTAAGDFRGVVAAVG
jgi:predicted N-acetyltransferase YhbS